MLVVEVLSQGIVEPPMLNSLMNLNSTTSNLTKWMKNGFLPSKTKVAPDLTLIAKNNTGNLFMLQKMEELHGLLPYSMLERHPGISYYNIKWYLMREYLYVIWLMENQLFLTRMIISKLSS